MSLLLWSVLQIDSRVRLCYTNNQNVGLCSNMNEHILLSRGAE